MQRNYYVESTGTDSAFNTECLEFGTISVASAGRGNQ